LRPKPDHGEESYHGRHSYAGSETHRL
jgi:hypothetical protein